MPKLELYVRPGCPYCQKVIRFMGENKINVPLKDINNEQNFQTLIKFGGKQQVPCLFVDNKAMYESDEIIKWCKQNYLN